MLQERAGRRHARAPILEKVNNFFRVPLPCVRYRPISPLGEGPDRGALCRLNLTESVGNERKYLGALLQ